MFKNILKIIIKKKKNILYIIFFKLFKKDLISFINIIIK